MSRERVRPWANRWEPRSEPTASMAAWRTWAAVPWRSSNQAKEFDRLEQFSKLQAPPAVKFKDLESFLVNHKVLSGPFFPFEVRTDYVKVTEDTVLVPLTLQIRNRDITFNTKDGVAKGEVNVLGRVATITDHVVQTFEQTLEVEEPSELLGKALDQASVHWWALPLKPGRYRVDIAIKDVNNPDHVGTWAEGIVVPKYDDEKLSASSLILADKMEQVPTKQIGTGQFIIGNTYVRPRVSSGPAGRRQLPSQPEAQFLDADLQSGDRRQKQTKRRHDSVPNHGYGV